MKRVSPTLVFLFVLLLVCLHVPTCAQTPPPPPSPNIYAVTHPFALATATTSRLFGMGGFATCIPDAGFANPAFAGTLSDTTTVLRRSTTSFQSGLRLCGEQFSVATPLHEGRSGLQVTGFRLSTDAALPGAFPPGSALSLSEYDLAFHYGHRLGNRCVLGVGLSPVFHNVVENNAPGIGNLLRLRASSDQGFRIGGLYEFNPTSWLGAVYDTYDEDVVASSLGSAATTLAFTSEEMIVGYSRRLNDIVLAAIEWQQLTTEGMGTRQGDSGFRFGIEATLDNNVTFRAGSNDGALSLGLGLTNNRLKLNYAFIDGWNKDMVESFLGKSSTHQFEASYSF